MKRHASLAASFLLLSLILVAQEFRGTIAGRVLDPQGAPIANVKVVATETRTGTRSETLSDSSGQYNLPFLAPGEYRISAEASGFKRYERKGLTLGAGEHPMLDIRLDLGNTQQTVTVTGDVPLLNTSNAAAGQIMTTHQVEDFPLNGRTPLMLLQLSTGVLATGQPGATHPFDNQGPASFSMGGAPSQTSELLIDGAPDTVWDLRVAYNPPVDAVREVQVYTFQTDASFGHTGAGTANQVTKSGTNAFHGTAYEFNQTSAIDAAPFFDNKNGIPPPVTRYNQFGFTAGGPLWIPKLYNGRNKLFWFFAWEGINDSQPVQALSTVTVPAVAERAGDFSALLRLGSNYTIYDPSTGALNGTTITRQPFPNNVIPTNRLNPVALAYLQYYPAPNLPGNADGTDNYGSSGVDTDTFNNELGRIDYNLSDRNKMFWVFRHNDRLQGKDNIFGNIATGTTLSRINWGSMLDDVYIVSPSTVADVRLNWTRFVQVQGEPSLGFDPAKLGFPPLVAASSQYLDMPHITLGSCGSESTPPTSFYCLGDNTASRTPFDSYQLFGDLSKETGNHSLKWGADIRSYRKSNITYGNSSGGYTFSTNWTRGPSTGSAAAPIGQDLAAFLLGLPTSGQYDVNAYSSTVSDYMGLFFQDDWRARPSLTVNMGLRFEHEFPLTERYNRAVNGFDPAALLPVTAAARAAYAQNPQPLLPPAAFNSVGGLTFATAQNPDIYKSSGEFWSPRLGFAWSPSALGGKTVLRGGIGLFMFPVSLATNINQEGFSQTTSFVPTLNNYLSPNANLSNPFPAILAPAGSSLGAATFLGQPGVIFLNPQVHNPYSERWELAVQRQLNTNTLLEVSYIGNHAVRLPVTNTQLDYIPRRYLSTSGVRDQTVIDTLSATVPNPFYNLLPGTTLNGSTVSLAQLLAPYPQFPVGSGSSNGVVLQNDTAGGSYFNSLNLRVERRLSNGLSLIGNYMYSKLMEEDTRLNDSDPYLERRISADDRTHHFVVAAVYALPFGYGRRVDFNSRWKNGLFGGWNVTGIYTLQTGAPLNWSSANAIYYGGPLNFNRRNANSPSFDIAQFNTNASQQLSDNVRTFSSQFGNLRQDGINDMDASILKNFNFTEQTYLQLRFEAFNAINHPTFGPPNLTLTNKNFGLITTQGNLPRNLQIGARLVW
ncbi:MAG TPA: carboxypeptidase-like regulatory domain-containing protein [Bryobacteraceae bacterium]|nr:carboxypeptidase-like regulatory domain-containing protein [Bryobacteraceae bacterium]